MDITKFLTHLREIGSNPWAFLAYLSVIGAWVYVINMHRRLKYIEKLPEKDRAKVLLRDYNVTPKAGLSPEQWIRSRKHTFFFLAFLITLIVVATLSLVALTRQSKINETTTDGASSLNLTKPVTEISTVAPKENSGFIVKRIIEGKSPDPASKIYDIVLENQSSSQVLLSTFEVRWRYLAGTGAMVNEGAVLKPLAQYILELPIDVLDETTKEKRQAIYPIIVIPPRHQSENGIATLQVQLHYYFVAHNGYHPASDWNIIFNLSIIDDKGKAADVFVNRSWKI